MQHATYEISGMSCGHCVKAVDQALAAIAGVSHRQVAVGTATVDFDETHTTADAIREAIEDAGYQVVARR